MYPNSIYIGLKGIPVKVGVFFWGLLEVLLGSMLLCSIYFGLQGVVLWGNCIHYVGTWTAVIIPRPD